MNYTKQLISAERNDQKSEDISQCGIRKSEIDEMEFDIKVRHNNSGFLRKYFSRKKTIEKN